MPVEIGAYGGSVIVSSSAWTVEATSPEDSISVETGLINVGFPYEGSYFVTPTRETQTLPTRNKVLLDDIEVAPIPDNYGLITWDGSTLTVS